MRQDNQQRRRNRGGGGGGGQRRPRRGDYEPVSREPEPKLGFFQKIAAFFGGGPKKATSSGYSGRIDQSRRGGQQQSSSPRSDRSDRSDRPERSERSERQSRKPEIIEVSSPKLYVGNLSFDASESDLFELFNGVGKVQNAEIVSNKYTQKSKGFAFVTLQSVDEARRAVTELHDKEFMGRKLVVSGAKTSDSAASRESGDRDRSSSSERSESPERSESESPERSESSL